MKTLVLNGTKKAEWGKIAALIMAGSLVIPASARTVYDAGKALRQNGETGNYANPNGVWSYYYSLLAFAIFRDSFRVHFDDNERQAGRLEKLGPPAPQGERDGADTG